MTTQTFALSDNRIGVVRASIIAGLGALSMLVVFMIQPPASASTQPSAAVRATTSTTHLAPNSALWGSKSSSGAHRGTTRSAPNKGVWSGPRPNMATWGV